MKKDLWSPADAVARIDTGSEMHSWVACNSEFKPKALELQTKKLARHHRVRPALVGLIAELAFPNRRAAA